MKLFKSSILAMIALSVVTFSCKNDDDGDQETNSITINAESDDLENGYVISFGEDSEGIYDWDIVLVSEGITIVDGEFEGIGSLIYIDLLTDSMTGIPEGTYNFSNQGAFSINTIDAILNADIGDAIESDVSFGTNGSVVVEGTGNDRKITVSSTGPNSTTITATYRGNLQIIE